MALPLLTPLLLGVLGIVLAGPVPALMSRLSVLRRTPRAAMLLWQGVALAAVLSVLGAGLSLVSGLVSDGGWQHDAGPVSYLIAAIAGSLTVLVAVRLLWSGHRIGSALRHQRRRHREHVDLLGGPGTGAVTVLDHDLPVAWCLPSMTDSRIVVSRGALDALTVSQLTAVLGHEKAHLRARHDLVIEAFTVLHDAFPRWVSSRAALREVGLLVEVLADRAALRVSRPADLGGALLAVAGGLAPRGAMGAASTGSGLAIRVGLLADRSPHRVQAAVLTALAVTLVLAPTAFVVVPWLSGLSLL